MTEKEARLILDVRISRFDHAQDVNEALEIAKQALEEIQQYREIGTVEECREAAEKQKPKKPRLNYKRKFLVEGIYTCPTCGNARLKKYANERQNNSFCWDCGQAIDWSEEE